MPGKVFLSHCPAIAFELCLHTLRSISFAINPTHIRRLVVKHSPQGYRAEVTLDAVDIQILLDAAIGRRSDFNPVFGMRG